MEIGRSLLISVYALAGLYLLYRLFFRKDPFQDEYEKLNNKIVTHEKYKVKGQYDKEE